MVQQACRQLVEEGPGGGQSKGDSSPDALDLVPNAGISKPGIPQNARY